jgi:hypothetical protein
MSSNQNKSAGSARQNPRPAARTVGTGRITGSGAASDSRAQSREEAEDARLLEMLFGTPDADD